MIIIASIFVFCIAAVFRLLDNSAGILISNGISVSPFYLSRKEIKEQMKKIRDKQLRRKLKRTLLFQRLHKVFLLLALVTFIAGVVYEFINPTLVSLL
ncbi:MULTISPECIES: hypothetical protein [unclassified Leeuwenhoekiella]|uniref:hypothetical protein n=1 Tax=unclassified Leeuwenhoekiella TaxID=2615029 RepID=UPI000C6647D2|nr:MULTISPECIES: hypothetical protein [unclassified Leeuwenhoekiella]MAW94206.1 hypothetical protein [Leeuwenhoekiella sp.]MAW96260.1 hypothetical protein [Leeuwenhoekiella sp.]MBA80254.1 hypothetical protein [Leeuwenhoekiella sp.]|tara:strand:- start:25200 stop:25493 length:294 start_codon:yes stop_codon:yes gene_type:complete